MAVGEAVWAAGESDGDGGTVAEHIRNESPEEMMEDDKTMEPTATNTVWTLVKIVFILALLIALIYLILRFVHSKTKSFASDRAIQSIGGVYVGSNRSVQLVKVGGRVFVIGVGESVSLLKEIEDEDEVAELLKESGDDAIDHSFGKIRHWLRKRRPSESRRVPFKSMLQANLQQMKQERNHTMEQFKQKDRDK